MYPTWWTGAEYACTYIKQTAVFIPYAYLRTCIVTWSVYLVFANTEAIAKTKVNKTLGPNISNVPFIISAAEWLSNSIFAAWVWTELYSRASYTRLLPPNTVILRCNYIGAKATSLIMDTSISQLCVYIEKRQKSNRISRSLQCNSALRLLMRDQFLQNTVAYIEQPLLESAVFHGYFTKDHPSGWYWWPRVTGGR